MESNKLKELIVPVDEPVMYIFVNNDLKMGKGKIAGQCCHVACRVTRIIERNLTGTDYYKNDYLDWIQMGEPKIILKTTEEILLKIIEDYSDLSKNIWGIEVRDLGRTQIKPNSLTAVAFNPIRKSQVPEFIKYMKLI